MASRIEAGSCFCGAIAAEMRSEPFWVCYDHDDDCRRAIGSPLNVWVGYRPDQVRFTRTTNFAELDAHNCRRRMPTGG